MRDLGVMGESVFSLWCADAGLVSNGSAVDKTGWDFLVEFPFDSASRHEGIHKSAIECKVQVKATDKNNRKIQIALSNLRRMITAQMPAFFVFIEFDGESLPQKAFVVHVDKKLITKVLKKMHKAEQENKEVELNKRTMMISYDQTHALPVLSGSSLKDVLRGYVSAGMADYVAKKKAHLESTGLEGGFAQITFTTEGEDNLRDLIDVSLGIKSHVEISHFKGINKRFGIPSKKPFVDAVGGKLEMPDLKPRAEGFVKFKEDNISAGLSFPSKIYISPFNALAPDSLKKWRIEGEFFDLIFYPYTGAASYSFSYGEGVRLEVSKFRDALKLLGFLCSPGKKVLAELIYEGLPRLEFSVGGKDRKFDLSEELMALESAVKIISYFDMSECVDISFNELSVFQEKIRQMYDVILRSPEEFSVNFSIDSEGFDASKRAACVFLVSAPIGSHSFGYLLVLAGNVTELESGKYDLVTDKAVVEKRIVVERDKVIPAEDMEAAAQLIEAKYSDHCMVVMFDF